MCLCGFIDGLIVFVCMCVALLLVYVCVYGSMCVVIGLDRLIGVS